MGLSGLPGFGGVTAAMILGGVSDSAADLTEKSKSAKDSSQLSSANSADATATATSHQ